MTTTTLNVISGIHCVYFRFFLLLIIFLYTKVYTKAERHNYVHASSLQAKLNECTYVMFGRLVRVVEEAHTHTYPRIHTAWLTGFSTQHTHMLSLFLSR